MPGLTRIQWMGSLPLGSVLSSRSLESKPVIEGSLDHGGRELRGWVYITWETLEEVAECESQSVKEENNIVSGGRICVVENQR